MGCRPSLPGCSGLSTRAARDQGSANKDRSKEISDYVDTFQSKQINDTVEASYATIKAQCAQQRVLNAKLCRPGLNR